MDLDPTIIPIIWEEYGRYAIVGALLVALVALVATIRRASRRVVDHKPQADHDYLSNGVTLMVLALTAEGMFWVLTTKLSMPLPWYLAVFVCAVAEGLMVNFFRLARKFNDDHGRPGPFGTAFWIVAIAEGCLVALASNNVVEIALRLLLPLGVALLHWIKLTAENSQENRGRFMWTPLNLLIRLGAWKPGDTTISEAEAKRFEAKLTDAAYMLASARWGKARKARRVRKMMLRATEDTATAVIAHLELAYGVEARIAAVTTRGTLTVGAARGDTQTKTPTNEVIPAATVDVPTTPINGHRVNGTQRTITTAPTPRAITAYAMSPADRDADIIVRYWDVLTDLLQAGTLCRSAIERVCTVGQDKVLARQANRIAGIVRCASTLDGDDVEARVRAAIDMIAANRA